MKKLLTNQKTWIVIAAILVLFIFYQFSQNGRYQVQKMTIERKEYNFILDTQTGSIYETGSSSEKSNLVWKLEKWYD